MVRGASSALGISNAYSYALAAQVLAGIWIRNPQPDRRHALFYSCCALPCSGVRTRRSLAEKSVSDVLSLPAHCRLHGHSAWRTLPIIAGTKQAEIRARLAGLVWSESPILCGDQSTGWHGVTGPRCHRS